MMDIKEVLFQRFINFFNKNSSGSSVKSEIMLNRQLAEEFHKSIIRKLEKRRKDNKDNI